MPFYREKAAREIRNPEKGGGSMKLAFSSLIAGASSTVLATCDNDHGGCDTGGCDVCQSGCEGGEDGCDGSYG